MHPQKFKTSRLVIPGFRPSENDIHVVNTQHMSIAERVKNSRTAVILCQEHDVAMVSVRVNGICFPTKIICCIINSK